jgi:type IV pilus assembly protein PilC
MPIFDYKAKDRAGTTVAGTVDAIDEHSAAEMIREMGHLPMSIGLARVGAQRQASAEAGSAFARYLIYPLWTGVNLKMLALFYRQLATLLASGMSLSEGLRSIGNRTRGRFGIIIDEMRENVSNGGRLSDTMIRYPKVFSRLQIALVRAGEGGGLMDSMVERIASYLEYEIKIRALIAKALIYPVVILVFAVIMQVAIPHISVLIFNGLGPFFTLVWPSLRSWILRIVLIIVALKLVFQFYTPRLIWDGFKVNIPVVGGNARKIAMSRFSRAMAVLYAAGMSMSDCIDIAADACANLYIGRAMKHAIPAIQSGVGLTESLTKTKAVSPMVLDMMSVGERSGSTDAVLEKVADYMDEEVDASIHKIGIALFVLMILIAAVVVGSIVIGFWGKLYGGLIGAAGK